MHSISVEQLNLIFDRNAAGVVLKVAYGYEVSPDNDHFINSIENFFSENEKALGRPYLVDFVPLRESLSDVYI